MSAQLRDATRLQEISSAFVAGKISRDEARSAVIQLIFERIGCSRVSLWRFDGEPGALHLLCFAACAVGGALDTRERRLTSAEYGDYFNALIATGMYVSDDAQADAPLQPMRDSYLVPHDVGALLDAVFMVNGRAYGMVCCEQTGAPRTWRRAEVAAVRAIVSKLAMLMAGADDPALWGSPSVPMAPM